MQVKKVPRVNKMKLAFRMNSHGCVTCMPLDHCSSLLTTHYSLLATHYPLLITHHSLLTKVEEELYQLGTPRLLLHLAA